MSGLEERFTLPPWVGPATRVGGWGLGEGLGGESVSQSDRCGSYLCRRLQSRNGKTIGRVALRTLRVRAVGVATGERRVGCGANGGAGRVARGAGFQAYGRGHVQAKVSSERLSGSGGGGRRTVRSPGTRTCGARSQSVGFLQIRKARCRVQTSAPGGTVTRRCHAADRGGTARPFKHNSRPSHASQLRLHAFFAPPPPRSFSIYKEAPSTSCFPTKQLRLTAGRFIRVISETDSSDQRVCESLRLLWPAGQEVAD